MPMCTVVRMSVPVSVLNREVQLYADVHCS